MPCGAQSHILSPSVINDTLHCSLTYFVTIGLVFPIDPVSWEYSSCLKFLFPYVEHELELVKNAFSSLWRHDDWINPRQLFIFMVKCLVVNPYTVCSWVQNTYRNYQERKNPLKPAFCTVFTAVLFTIEKKKKRQGALKCCSVEEVGVN